ncbi:hypothetical protein ALC56_14087 [Trachymyrmex septentrionalis]|uniref:Uncharacterized protein n=1 Tax=Trachymyrmex septentrionalis TaxID=34720 RepID=A0A195EUN2_9HYME|nr:hypothetical protein ALC56_14087 [Trachymyrmex septentrionalis]
MNRLLYKLIHLPRLISTGLAPLLIFSNPSLAIALANMVAVVVPSPASSLDPSLQQRRLLKYLHLATSRHELQPQNARLWHKYVPATGAEQLLSIQ